MGAIIPFAEMKRAKLLAGAQPSTPADREQATAQAIGTALDQSKGLAAARPLLDRCRDRYGFVVMRDGLPNEPATLSSALLELFRGLSMLNSDMSAPRTYPAFGVYFGRPRLAWFEDGYGGETGLAVPISTKAADLAAFVRPRLARPRSRSQK